MGIIFPIIGPPLTTMNLERCVPPARAMHSLTGVPTGTLRIVGCATSPVTVRNFLVNGSPSKASPIP